MNLFIYSILNQKKPFNLKYSAFFKIGNKNFDELEFSDARKMLAPSMSETKKIFANIYTSNEQFNHWLERCKTDLLSLLAETPYGKYPYAGVPWYNTAFGRDGLLTAYETLWIAPEISRDVLMFLAKNQATEENAYQDAEPGKILHEARGGEMVEVEEIPFKKYYGTIDATPLFIVLAGAYYERTGDIDTIKEIWNNIEGALFWIDNYGDLDGDGFIEYKHKSEKGLTNQCWKDSYDSVMYEDGRLCEPPIAMCEVQGYVYDAKIKASKLASALQKDQLSERLNAEADALKRKFNDAFWDEALGTYVLALDGEKKPCRVKASNAGHCLWSKIADDDKAARVVQTLMSDEMSSGWGIRTLGTKEVRYNPMSYHNGSIWPHDVAIVAYGMTQYGFQREANEIMTDIYDASLYMDLQRLPELYCGFNRRDGEGPTAYPVACSPQAWSVAAVFMLLQSCFHISFDAKNKVLTFNNPYVPEYLETVNIERLKLGDEICSFELRHYADDVGVTIRSKPKDWEIRILK